MGREPVVEANKASAHHTSWMEWCLVDLQWSTYGSSCIIDQMQHGLRDKMAPHSFMSGFSW